MSGLPEPTQPVPNPEGKCPRCGYECHPQDTSCPQCGASLTASASPSHSEDRVPPTLPSKRQTKDLFESHARAILQFFPSRQCVSLSLETPLILGRKGGPGLEGVFDLTDFNACPLGVSRRHCLLQRRGTHLTVTDLGSFNGTYLNGKRIPPHLEHSVAHGDHLALGLLHLTISFSTTESE